MKDQSPDGMAPSGLAQLVEKYLSEARKDDLFPAMHEPLTKRTLKQWGFCLRRLAKDLGPEAGLSDFNRETLLSSDRRREADGRRPRTRCSHIFAWRAFGRWLVAIKQLESNPAMEIRLPKLDKPRRKVCTDQQVRDAINACERLPDMRRGVMAKAILHVVAFGLLRRTELLSLRVSSVNLDDCSIDVWGKGDKPGNVVFTPENFAPIRAWLAVRDQCRTPERCDLRGKCICRCRHGYLWAGHDASRRLGDAGLRTLLQEVYAIAGHRDNPGLLPHGMRHNGATRLLQNRATLDDVRVALRHAHITTTALYLHVDEIRKREVAELAGFVREEQKEKREQAKKTSDWRRTAQWRRGGRE